MLFWIIVILLVILALAFLIWVGYLISKFGCGDDDSGYGGSGGYDSSDSSSSSDSGSDFGGGDFGGGGSSSDW